MADQNSLRLDATSFLPEGEWAAATDARRRRYLDRAGDFAVRLKLRQVRLGIGADGRRLRKVRPSSRPDNATGKPLDPHYGQSRAVRWLRDSAGAKAGTVTLWWSHGWGEVLGYHARGEVKGAPTRDVIGWPVTYRREFERLCMRFWKTMARYRGRPRRRAPAGGR